jgi:S1-C subfamily serine protease
VAPRRPALTSRSVLLLVSAASALLVGVVAFLATVNRTEVARTAPSAHLPAATEVVATSSPSIDDVARAVLARTVTIEALGSNDEGLGTGWLIDAKGDFVTNAHVVQGQLAVRIRGRDGSSHVGTVVGVDRALDIAVVRSRDGFPGAPLAPLTTLLSGLPQPVVVIASSHATGHGDITDETATGVQSDVPVTGDTVTGQPPVTTDYHDMLVLDGQTIYPGNSGGPVIDSTGRVVGILTLASKSTTEAYAIQVSRVIAELRTFTAR